MCRGAPRRSVVFRDHYRIFSRPPRYPAASRNFDDETSRSRAKIHSAPAACRMRLRVLSAIYQKSSRAVYVSCSLRKMFGCSRPEVLEILRLQFFTDFGVRWNMKIQVQLRGLHTRLSHIADLFCLPRLIFVKKCDRL